MTGSESLFPARRYFVLHRMTNGEKIVAERDTEHEARQLYDDLIRMGWPITRSAAIYTAESREQLEDHLAKRVQLVCGGVGAGYWESPEGLEQRSLAALQEERDCLEDLA